MLRTLFFLAAAAFGYAQTTVDHDFTVPEFTFKSGETMRNLRLHYTTLGTIRRDGAGHARNAVLIGHGTGGTGRAFLSPGFGGELFGKGQPLDTEKYFIILPDGIGHGQSSKPSDGLHAKFPHYRYDDMVRADYLTVHDDLKIDHLRLVMGTSMGAMHAWIWGELYPEFMDALMPLASQTVEIAGRNRMLRDMVIDSIRSDPEWKDGEYTTPPHGLIAAQFGLFMMTSSPLQLYKANPTREAADQAFGALKERALRVDANDMLYQYEASTDYNPQPMLGNIKAPLFAINSADDEVNPPELGIMERDIKKVRDGRYILIPTSDATRGHGTHSRAAIWKSYLIELLDLTSIPAPSR